MKIRLNSIENTRNKLITPVEDLDFQKAVKKVIALHNAEIDISDLNPKNMNANKIA